LGKILKPWEGLGGRLDRAVAQFYATTGKRLTGEDLAAAVGRSGATVSLWINGQSYPSLEQVCLLAHALEISPSWLAFGEGSPLAGHHEAPKSMPQDHLERVPSQRKKAR
jgi:transcriptional regulator with XRE-family HTH domain